MKTPRQKTPDHRFAVDTRARARTRPVLMALAAALVALLTACATTRPVTVSHPAMGLHIDLPPGFVDATPDILRRHQSRRQPNDADISAEPLVAFDEKDGARGCLISRLSTRDSALPGLSTALQVALTVSGMHGQRLDLQNAPWPLMASGQSIGLGSDGSLPPRPLAQAIVSSRAGSLGLQPGWLVITQQQWPPRAGPMQGATRMATLVTEAGSPQDGRRQWWMAQCGAAHFPDYVDGYLDELLDTVRAARWQTAGNPGMPLTSPVATVPQ